MMKFVGELPHGREQKQEKQKLPKSQVIAGVIFGFSLGYIVLAITGLRGGLPVFLALIIGSGIGIKLVSRIYDPG